MDLPQSDIHLSGTESAKAALLGFAREHDTRRELRAKPMRTMLIVGGAAAILTRVLIGGARRARGGKLMGVLLLARMAMKFGPALLVGVQRAKRAYDESQARQGGARQGGPPVRVRARLVDRAPSLPRR